MSCGYDRATLHSKIRLFICQGDDNDSISDGFVYMAHFAFIILEFC